MIAVVEKHLVWVSRKNRRLGIAPRALGADRTLGFATQGTVANLTAEYKDKPDPDDANFILRFVCWSVVGLFRYTTRDAIGAGWRAPSPGRFLRGDNYLVAFEDPCPILDVGGAGFVGNMTVDATAWYVQDDGSSTGINVDAFDVVIGSPIGEDFVGEVTPDDPARTLLLMANEEGAVPTANSAETVMALRSLGLNRPLLGWRLLFSDGGVSVTSAAANIHAQQGSRGVAWAFYRAGLKDIPIIHNRPEDWWELWFPGPPHPAAVQALPQFMAGLQLATIAQNLAPQFIARAVELAAEQAVFAAMNFKEGVTPKAAVSGAEEGGVAGSR